VVRFATLSNGTVVEPSNVLKRQQARLKRYQRMIARRVKLSSNWKKAKDRLNSIHRKIRNDFLHKTTTAISKNHAIVLIEDLKVRNMCRSAAGTKNEGSAGSQRQTEVRPQPQHSGSSLGRVPPPQLCRRRAVRSGRRLVRRLRFVHPLRLRRIPENGACQRNAAVRNGALKTNGSMQMRRVSPQQQA